MNEIEFERLSELLRAKVNVAHNAWLRQPTNGKRLNRYEDALACYIAGRQDMVDRLFSARKSMTLKVNLQPVRQRGADARLAGRGVLRNAGPYGSATST